MTIKTYQWNVQRTEVVDDASWVTGFLDIFDPALDSIKRLLNFDQTSQEILGKLQQSESSGDGEKAASGETSKTIPDGDSFNLDAFIMEKLSLDASKLDEKMEKYEPMRNSLNRRNVWTRSKRQTSLHQSSQVV